MLDRRQYQHIALNMGGLVLPMLAGALVVPDLIRRLGTDRFGVLSISWVLVGYFGLLDLGLSRGLTQYLSYQMGRGATAAQCAAAARIVRTWMLGLGITWTLLLLVGMPWIISTGLKIPLALQQEAQAGWVSLALSVPLLLWASHGLGLLEAHSRFPAINLVRIPMGIATFVAPWLVAHWSVHLGLILSSLLIVRAMGAMALAAFSHPYLTTPPTSAQQMDLRHIVRFGGWLTVTNVIGPLLSYFDRFAIGAFLSVAAVTYYTVPFDVLSRLPTLPLAMMSVLFPLLAQLHGQAGLSFARQRAMLQSAVHLLLGFWAPAMVVGAMLGAPILAWWVGPDLAQESTPVWHWIAVGVLLNGFAHIPYGLLQSAGRSDLTAKFHMAELIPYAAALAWGLNHHGITGVAMAWTLRIVMDTALLYTAAAILFPETRRVMLLAACWAFVCAGLSALIVGWMEKQHQLSPSPTTLGIALAIATVWCGVNLRQLRRLRA